MAIYRDGTGKANLDVVGFEYDDLNSLPTRIQVKDKDGYTRWLACTDVDEAGIPVIHIDYPGVYGFQGGRIEASYSGVMEIEPLEITDPNQTIVVPENVKYDPITVNIPIDFQDITLSQIPDNGDIEPESGYVGFEKITVNIPTNSPWAYSTRHTNDPYAENEYYETSDYYIDHGSVVYSNQVIGFMNPQCLLHRGSNAFITWANPSYASQYAACPIVQYRKCGSSFCTTAFNSTNRSNLDCMYYVSTGWIPVGGGSSTALTNAFDYTEYAFEAAKNQGYGLAAVFDTDLIGPVQREKIFNIPTTRPYMLSQALFLTNLTEGLQEWFLQNSWTKSTITHLGLSLNAGEDTLYTGCCYLFPDLIFLDIASNVQYIQSGFCQYCPNLQVLTLQHSAGTLPDIDTHAFQHADNIKHVFVRDVYGARSKYADFYWADYIETMPNSWYMTDFTVPTNRYITISDFKINR